MTDPVGSLIRPVITPVSTCAWMPPITVVARRIRPRVRNLWVGDPIQAEAMSTATRSKKGAPLRFATRLLRLSIVGVSLSIIEASPWLSRLISSRELWTSWS
jgi:hypothetical protein